MTTSERSVSSNKAALRASLKKEDESLAGRIVDTDVTELVAPPPASAAPAEPPREESIQHSPQAAAAVSEPREEGQAAVLGEEKSSAKGAVKTAKPGRAEAPAAAASKRAKPAASAKGKAAAKAGAASKTKKPPVTPPVAVQEETTQRVDDGRKARGKSAKGSEKRPAEVKTKPEKVVRFALDLLKSETAAIEGLRGELSKTAGWAASRSDILRAGVRLFAEQTPDRRKELLTGLTSTAKGKKKG